MKKIKTMTCEVCGKEKPITSLLRYKRKDGTIAHRPICSNCNMKAHRNRYKAIIEALNLWVNESHDYLSQSTEYAKGYKEGINQAKELIKNLLNNE